MRSPPEQISLTVAGREIAGTLIAPPNRKEAPGLLFVHGWGASQEQCLPEAYAVAELGCACLTFDLRGHGARKAERDVVSREDNLRDVLAGYDWLTRGRRVTPVGIVGTSYGAYLAAIATSLRPLSCLALQAPAIYPDGNWSLPKIKLHADSNLTVYRSRIVGSQDNRALRACATFRGDVLIVSSEYDTVVPRPVSESYVGACSGARSLSRKIIAHADHGLSEESWRREYRSILQEWAKATVACGKQDSAFNSSS